MRWRARGIRYANVVSSIRRFALERDRFVVLLLAFAFATEVMIPRERSRAGTD